MSPEAELLLERSMEEYNQASEITKSLMRSSVEYNLESNKNAIKHIGMGAASYYVEAAEEFLKRIS